MHVWTAKGAEFIFKAEELLLSKTAKRAEVIYRAKELKLIFEKLKELKLFM